MLFFRQILSGSGLIKMTGSRGLTTFGYYLAALGLRGGFRKSIQAKLKPCRLFRDYSERTFQRQSHLTNQTVIEQSAQNCYAVRDASRRIEFG